jgi:hypothetical protein
VGDAGSALAESFGLGFIARSFPRPVRRVEVKAQKKWLTRFGVAVDDADGTVTEECCEVSGFMYEHVFVPKIFVESSCRVVEVIDRADAESIEVVIAAFERTEIRQRAEVPLADERRSVTCFSEQRRQRRMVGWEADGIDALDAPGARRGNRFFQANAKPILIASGDERGARCRTDCGIGVALSEADAAGGDVGRCSVSSDRGGRSIPHRRNRDHRP